MARITRKTSSVFGGSAGAVALGVGQFGSAQALAPTFSTDPAVIQALAAWLGGWSDATLGGSKFPAIEDMNGVQYVQSYMMAYVLQEGIPEYDSGTPYYLNSIVKNPGSTQLFKSLTNANEGNALPAAPASNANWGYLCDLGAIGTPLQQAANLSDLASLATALTNLGFVTSLGTSGCYVKLPGGLIIQSGQVTVTSGSTGTTLTFPTSFTTRLVSLDLTWQETAQFTTGVPKFMYNNALLTGAPIWTDQTTGGPYNVGYIATGY